MDKDNKITRTYSIKLYDDRFFNLCKESGLVYSTALNLFHKKLKEEKIWLSKFDLQKEMKNVTQRTNLHSDSYLAAMQQVHANLASWKEAKKVRPDAKIPHKSKFLQPIFFKQSQIKYREGKLCLTLDAHRNYLKINWNKTIPIPVYGSVSYNKFRGWKLNLVIEFEQKEVSLNEKKIMSIDLGVKRTATCFDGERVITLSGKKLRGLVHYRNKISAETQTKLSKKEKGSKRYKKIQRAKRKKVDRLLNMQADILHKQVNFIVDYAINKKIGKIVIGDCSSIHNKTNLGKVNNQQVQQNPEQKLKRYIEEKFSGISGQVEIIPEAYTTKTCPCCGKLNHPKNRRYSCMNKECNYQFDRDGVGSINIYQKASSIEHGRIRSLAEPFGVKFHDHLSWKNLQMLLVKAAPLRATSTVS